MTRAELRHKVLFERWLQSDGDLTFGEWLDSLRERAKRLREGSNNNAMLQQAMMQGMQNSPYYQQQMQNGPYILHQMGGDNPLAGLGGALGSLLKGLGQRGY